MQNSQLTKQAQEVLNGFLNLSLEGHHIACPYFNNKKHGVRGALRVTIGKGSAEEIVQEAHLTALKKRVDLSELNPEDMKKFLVDNHLGIDCSGFVYYVLDAERQATNETRLTTALKRKRTLNPLRAIIRRLRHVENTNVALLADKRNSTSVAIKDVAAGDIIVMLKTGNDHARDHVLLVDEVSGNVIHYTHALQWSKDGAYNHGVRQGTITVENEHAPLPAQKWEESGVNGKENETFARAQRAETLDIRRLR